MRVPEQDTEKSFGLKRIEITGEWNQLYSEELHDLYYLTGVSRAIKSKRMRWAVRLACMGEIKILKRFGGKP